MPVTFGSALRRGALAGVAGGLAAAVVLTVVLEPLIDRAIAIEDARTQSRQLGPLGSGEMGHAAREAVVSRTAQVVTGFGTELLVGLALGLVFAVVFVRARHRLAGSEDVVRSTVLAAVGFAALTLLPALTVPANPPGVGEPSSAGRRTMLYVVVLLLGLAVAVALPSLDRWLSARVSPTRRWTLDVVGLGVAVVLLLTLIPDLSDPVPPDVPAELLWDFRLASLGQLAVLWAVLGVTFGVLMERVATRGEATGVAAA